MIEHTNGRRRNRFRKRLFLEQLEPRLVLTGLTPHSFAFDLIDLYDMRRDPDFQEVDGDGIGIAIIDTGVDITHDMFTDRVVANVDLVYQTEGNYYTSNHGTHVAGIAAGEDPDIGVANQADVISLQVFSETDGYSSWVEILGALQWVRENHHAHNIKVVNMSLGGGLFATANDGAAVTQDVYREILNLERLGVTVVSAAGNEYGIDRSGQSQMLRNANAPGIYSTLVVGAVWESYEGGGICMGEQVCDVTTASDRIVHFSQRPPAEDNVVFAPGAFILSSVPGNGYSELAGTSMAAPMVAGTVALMQDAAMTFGGRYLETSEIQEVIRNSADLIHDGDDENSITTVDGVSFAYTHADYARLNVHRAVQAVRDLVETHGEREDRYAVNSGDANSTLAGAYQGPALPLRWSTYDNDPNEAVKLKGILGKDGRRFESGDADVDMFRFEVTAPGVVILQTEAWGNREPADTLLRLFDENGTFLVSNDDYDNTTYSHLEAALPVGVYYVGVSGSGNESYSPVHPGSGTAADRGHYKLAFSWANDDLNGFLDTAVQVSFNQGDTAFTGLIGQDYGNHVGTQDVDLFRLVVPDDGQVMVDIDTPYGEGFVDSFLRVFDADGNELVYNDDQLEIDQYGNLMEYADDRYPGYVFEHPTDRQYFDGHTTDSFVMGSDLEQGQVLYFGVSGRRNHSYNPMSVDARRQTSGGFYEVEFQFISKDLSGNINQAMSLPDANTWYEELIYFDWDSVAGEWAEVSE
ncbi:MAG: S8 family serine peptidase [Planctomycetota bacterium]|nr:S8 family serine peptidase [Planctomycetota bacterium]